MSAAIPAATSSLPTSKSDPLKEDPLEEILKSLKAAAFESLSCDTEEKVNKLERNVYALQLQLQSPPPGCKRDKVEALFRQAQDVRGLINRRREIVTNTALTEAAKVPLECQILNEIQKLKIAWEK